MNQELEKQINAIRLIVSAMGIGLIVFGAIAIFLGPRMNGDASLANIFLPLLGLLAVTEFIAYLVLRFSTLKALRGEIAELPATEAEAKAMGTYTTLTLIRSAMAEAWGMFGIVILMVTGVKLAIAAPLLALVVLAAGFPSRQKLTDLATTVTGRNPFAG